MPGLGARAQELLPRGLTQACFRGASGEGSETQSLARAVVPMTVSVTLAAATGPETETETEKRGLAGLAAQEPEGAVPGEVAPGEVEAALGALVPELVGLAEPVLAQLVPEQAAALAVVFVVMCLEPPAWPDCLTEVRPRHWSPVPQPAHWPAVRNLSPAWQARWVVRCSSFSLQPL